MALFNCPFYRAEYLNEFKAVHITFKGIVQSDQIVKLRGILGNLSTSLKVEKLILDFSECDYAFIDYNSHGRIEFWKSLEHKGLKKVLLIISAKYFSDKLLKSWASFYNTNHLSIQLSAISDKKQLPLFILSNSVSTQSYPNYEDSK